MRTAFINRVAAERFNGWRNREKFTQLTGENKPEDMGEAYHVQSAVYEAMRQGGGFTDFAGHKVALTSPAIQEMCGVDQPAYGSVFAEFVHQNDHQIDPGKFIRLGIEFEVALEIGEDVPLADQLHTKESISHHVSAVRPAFELIDDRDADYAYLDAMSILCDRCWCGGVVLGPRVENWRHLDLGNLESSVVWNSEADEQGNTGAALGNPLNSAAFVANHLQERGLQLKAGEFVMTGSALKTRFPAPGDVAKYQVDGLGEVVASVRSLD